MCLRKLAGVMPLVVATSLCWAQERQAPVAALDTSSKVAAANGSSAGADLALRAGAAATAPRSSVASPAPREPNAPRDLKGLTAVIGGLALVGWFQRRRSGTR